ncbi:MAG: putative molybdenum carrier [Candidatus Nitrotoga sp. MKT]|nr:MAG: putative molybdenum carrier [Candidatus Nitrotoga sp. MKT]
MVEDGRISDRYQLQELPKAGYRQRTRQNVMDSDGTLIVNLGELDGGSLQTQRFAKLHGKPCLVIQAEGKILHESAKQILAWLRANRIMTLNVAGPRESKRTGIYRATLDLLYALLGNEIPSELK